MSPLDPNTVIAQHVRETGRMPGRDRLRELIPSLSVNDAKYAVRDYALAHPGALRAKGGTPEGSKMIRHEAQQAPTPTVSGYTAGRRDPRTTEQDVYERAISAQARTAAKTDVQARQIVSFPHGPVALAFIGDVHFGNSATDYRRAFEEAELIAATPGMYAVTTGDLLDQFIIGKLAAARFNAPLSIEDEWMLVRRFLRILAPKLKVAVSGNHDGWAQILTGVDFFRDTLAQIAPDCLYDSDDCLFTWRVGEQEKRVRVRHKWSGSSIYNPTHGQEKAAKWDQNFDVAVGAHTHTGGYSRDTTAGGRNILAIQTGSYKQGDSYARREGFSLPNNSTAVAVVLTDKGDMQGFNSLRLAADYLRLKWGK